MSGEREALMMGARDEFEVTERYSNGKSKKKTYKFRPVRVRELLELERKALRAYKREYLTTFKDNADLFGDSSERVLRDEMSRVAKWTLEDLPQIDAYTITEQIKITPEVLQWGIENSGIDFTEEFGLPLDSEEIEDKTEAELQEYRQIMNEIALRALMVAALDRGDISPEEVFKLTGIRPIHGKVRYDQWWVTGPIDGMVALIWEGLRQDYSEKEVNEEHVLNTWSYAKIVEASRLVDKLTQASLGNG